MQSQERVQSEDAQAILYQHYAPSIFAYLLRHSGSREDAEDILLEVFLAVLENARFWTLNEKEQQAWLWSVARNKAIDNHRRLARHPSIPLKQVADSIYEREDLAPEQFTLKQEEYRQLHTLLKTLPEQQQEVLRLRFGHGLRCAEIATVMTKSEGAVRMLLSRTLKLLRGNYKNSRKEDGYA